MYTITEYRGGWASLLLPHKTHYRKRWEDAAGLARRAPFGTIQSGLSLTVYMLGQRLRRPQVEFTVLGYRHDTGGEKWLPVIVRDR